MALTTASSLSVNKAAYEQLAYFALRPELYFDAMATVKATNETQRGTSITFTFNSELAAATTALTDGTDITPVAMSDSQVTVTPLEYGNAVQLTAKNKATAFYELNPVAANLIGWNAGLSVDTLAANAAVGGTQVAYGAGTTRATVTKAGVLTGSLVRQARAKLAGQNVQTFNGLYKGIIHPDVAYDLTGGTGGTNWSDPHVYSDPAGIFNGVIGSFQGVQFMQVPRSPLLFSDGGTDTYTISTITVSGNTATLTTSAAHGLKIGSTLTISGATATSGTGSTSQVGFNAQFTVLTVPTTTTLTVDITGKTATCTAGASEALVVSSIDVYATLIMGKECLAKAYSTGGGYGVDPIIGDVPVVDVAQRITGIYWRHFIGYGVFRQASIYRVESGSALAL
jgi:N4-gp56 family major capsid protein